MKPFNPEEAEKNHIIFYELPQNLDLNGVDPLLRPVVARINDSGWVWTAECCQGHPDYDENSIGGWDHNTDPFLRLVTTKERLGDMLAILAWASRLPPHDFSMADIKPENYNAGTRFDFQCVPMKIYMWPGELGKYEQIMVYLPSRNVLQRNAGIEVFTRFADAIEVK